MGATDRCYWLAGGLTFVLLLTGCLTPRQQEALSDYPRNRVFDPGRFAVELQEGATHAFGEYDRGDGQSICVLQLAPGSKLDRRYHAEHDMTLFVVSGNAIVVVEEMRYVVGPGSAVLLPRFTAYAVLPTDEEEEFRALLVYSPPFVVEDTFLEK